MVQIPVRGISFKNSEVLSGAFCDSSKPGRVGSRHVKESSVSPYFGHC